MKTTNNVQSGAKKPRNQGVAHFLSVKDAYFSLTKLSYTNQANELRRLLLDLQLKKLLPIQRPLKFVSYFYRSNSRGCSRINKIANLKAYELRHVGDDFIDGEDHVF